ncbi:VasL domain-containing protein [Enterobacter sp. PTB]|uniref:VasL domain-containing protein n=1 Tax=Enterobacter sp. PTB TaxID=3143437 RepID=UPI003DA8147F
MPGNTLCIRPITESQLAQGKGHWLAQIIGDDHCLQWAAGNDAITIPGESWGQSATTPVVSCQVHVAKVLSGNALSPEELLPELPAGAVRINLSHQLDGPLEGFGSRFWALISSQHPFWKRVFNEKREIAQVQYSDRYVNSPFTARLLGEQGKITVCLRHTVIFPWVEQLCVTLFRHNGTDLQTAAWFCCARLQRSGLPGLSEGLELVDSLITHQWSVMWPPQIPVRKDILMWLSGHLMLSLRRFTLSHQDLPAVYRLEQQFRHLCDQLQRMELRQVSKMDALLHWMHAAVVRLENAKDAPLPAAVEPSYLHTATPLVPDSAGQAYGTSEPVVLVVRDDGTQRITPTSILKRHRRGVWAGFGGGVAATLLFTAIGTWIWQQWHDRLPETLIATSLSPLPVVLSSSEQGAMIEGDAGALQSQGRVITERTRQQLDVVAHLSPSWAQDYGFTLVAQTQRLWPHQPETEALAKQWQQQVAANALPEARLQGWHKAMEQLQSLTNKLNSTDVQRGKYLTVSELKSSVFAITQTLSQNVPLEEQLRQLVQQKNDNGSQSATEQQAEQHLRQLQNRYALMTHTDLLTE